ncbi:hypothetical protein pneo_cds_186 [Pandoravirus neocaledonia]|uniref:Uncharacterized protein n=1 Tax=Pandoravirus neocaledonia TaxID=2107708 RepID=A0A2U7UBH6_9VIRU|nr:hypothetical protein pneo_cds_186 [Pandoravirus neocaledonia]AVK75793.1 hypothetical protein pneo_cds_186 [Pandoravirus neocaledonia]
MGKEKKKVRIPKKMPAWMEAMFIYVAKKDGASPRAYKPIMGLVETHWDAFVEECSAPPAPRAKKTPVKKGDSDDEAASDMAADGAGDEASETQFDPDDLQEAVDGDLDGDDNNGTVGTPMVDPEEQARIDEMVRDGIKSMPEPLRQSLRKAYGPPRTPAAPPAPKEPLGPGWRHAEKQADDLYGTFCSEAATVGVPQDHPMALSVSNLYSLAKGAIAARSSTPA